MVGAAALPAGLALDAVSAAPPREAGHGDIAVNAAMVLAKQARMPPRQIAEALAARLRLDAEVAAVEVAGPGFVNVALRDRFWHARLAEILAAGTAYGAATIGAGGRVNVEFVSANPTGPLHVGHGRGAVFGDALAVLLEKAGYKVTREYYINDAGGQIEALARSLYFRYREACGEKPGIMPEGLYPGDYLFAVAEALKVRDGTKWLNQPEPTWFAPVRDFAIEQMMALIRADLDRLGIRFDVFFSERSLHAAGRVEAALERLEQAGVIYTGVLEPPKGMVPEDWEPRPQTLFRATRFGDDVDRPLKKSDGSWTYFAADIAYHFDKIERGFPTLIDVWGADHSGYVKRVQAAIAALAGDKAELDVKICNMVRVLDRGVPVKMSKRSGEFVTLADVIDAVGRDVVRFIMLTRRNDAMLDFDLTKVLEQSRENPVFYVQYAHARARSVARRVAAEHPDFDLAQPSWGRAPLALLGHAGELQLVKRLACFPETVEAAARAHEPHRIAFYLYDLAGEFHAHWNLGTDDPALRFIVPGNRDLTFARLALVQGIATVIAAGLAVMGVTPVEEMR
jgi:arginyl-tRNA synthetase